MKKPKKNQSITYTYWHWDEESEKNLPITITAGQDNVTEEHIIMLNELDHAADLGDRYEQENRDFTIYHTTSLLMDEPLRF